MISAERRDKTAAASWSGQQAACRLRQARAYRVPQSGVYPTVQVQHTPEVASLEL
jgi:hypothetical protein